MFRFMVDEDAYAAGFHDGHNDKPYALNQRIHCRSYRAGYKAGSKEAYRQAWLSRGGDLTFIPMRKMVILN